MFWALTYGWVLRLLYGCIQRLLLISLSAAPSVGRRGTPPLSNGWGVRSFRVSIRYEAAIPDEFLALILSRIVTVVELMFTRRGHQLQTENKQVELTKSRNKRLLKAVLSWKTKYWSLRICKILYFHFVAKLAVLTMKLFFIRNILLLSQFACLHFCCGSLVRRLVCP